MTATHQSQHAHTLYLSFTPGCIPYAETVCHHLIKVNKPILSLGLAYNQTLRTPTLTIPSGPFASQGSKTILAGKQTIARYFSRLGAPQLYDQAAAPEVVQQWMDLLRLGNLSELEKKLESVPRGNYLTSADAITLADVLVWDFLKIHGSTLSSKTKEWVAKLESLVPVQSALKEIEAKLNTIHHLGSIKFEIARQLSELIGKDTDVQYLYSIMEEPRDKSKGDLSVPLMRLRLKDVNMNELMAQLAKNFKPTDMILSATPSGPFLAFTLNKDALRKKVITQIHSLGPRYGANAFGAGNFAVVEFSSPNIAKPFHAGHLRSTIIGNFTRHVLEANGWATLSMNYLGDWGKQYGLLAVGYEKFGSDAELEKDAIRHLFDVYVKVNALATENPEVHDDARLYFKRMEDGDPTALALWQRFRDLSITKYKDIYARLNVEFDVYSGESQYSLSQMQSVLDELSALGLLKPDQGALMVDLKEHKLGTAIIGKTDGSMLYLSRDIAANIERKKLYDFDEMFYIVGTQQEHHFKQLFLILELMGKDWASKCHHINFGMIKSKDGNMSTRKGSVVFLEEILDQVKEEMHAVMKKNEVKYAQVVDPEGVSDIVGMSAIMIQDMSARRHKDYEFDWNRMLSFEGDTGPYLQYAHARLRSIERAALESYGPPDPCPNLDLLVEPKAHALIDLFAVYPDVIRELGNTYEPTTLVSYILKLSHAVSQALDTLYVMGRERELAMARLAMYSAARIILGNSLKLLGLKPLDRM